MNNQAPKLILTQNQGYLGSIFDDLDVNENTRKDYLSRLPLFLSYVQNSGFNQQSYLSFKRYLRKRNDYTTSTKNKYLATSRIFLKELVRRGKLSIDITNGIKHFKQTKQHKRQGLTDTEIQLLWLKLQSLPSTERNRRLRALFSLLAFQGLRQIEIVRLNLDDLDLRRKTALIQGKGCDDKEIIYLTPTTIKVLKEYLRDFRASDGSLFRSIGNKKSERITTMTIKREVGSLFDEMGITDRSVHGFRHFYVTELLKTMEIRDVRKFSRHKSLEMLVVYDDERSIQHKTPFVFSAMEKFNTA